MPASALRDDVHLLGNLARKLCGNQPDADDLVQDTLERALRAWPAYAECGNRRGWLATILRNRFRDGRRAARLVATDEPDELPAPEPTPRPSWERVTPEHVAAALAQLDEPFRRVYQLHAEGFSYVQIARELGIPTNTVGSRLMRARTKLRQLLTQLVP